MTSQIPLHSESGWVSVVDSAQFIQLCCDGLCATGCAGDCAESWAQAGEYGSTSSLGVHRLVEQTDTHKM